MTAKRYFWRNLILAGVVSGASLSAFAVNPAPIAAASFNPNNLVSDSIFTAKDAMTLNDIQTFLLSKNSVLTKVSSSDLSDNLGRTAAKIIWDASREVMTDFGSSEGFNSGNPLNVAINPQAILATLQKEQSLITAAYVPGSSQTTTALQHAMGYGCPDSGGCDPTYDGFTNQVKYATAQLYLDYYRATATTHAAYKIGQTYTFTSALYQTYCTSTSMSVTIANGSTSALYRYTPHVCNGNANFWIYMNTWFADAVNLFSPVARLIKSVDTDPIYLYWPAKNLKWYVSSADAIAAWGVTAPQEYLSQAQVDAIPNGTGSFSKLQKGSDDAVYYLEGGKKYHVRTGSLFPAYGVTWDTLRTIDDMLMSQLPNGAPLGFLTKSSIRDEVYYITGARKYYVPDGDTLVNWGFTWADISPIPQVEIDAYSSGGNLNFLGISENGGNVYLMALGKRLYIPSTAMMTAWNLNFGMMSVYGKDTPYLLPLGPTLSQVAKGSGPSVYYITAGQKRYASSEAKLRAKGVSLSNLVQVSDSLLNRLPTGSPL
jgi:hypothetical protein